MPLRRIHNAAFLSAVLIAAACTSNAPPTAPSQPTFTAQDSAAFVELMQLEDTRTFDAPSFDRLYAGSELIRAQVALSAGRISDRKSEAFLLRALSDASAKVRINAAFSLGELGDSAQNVVDALGALTTVENSVRPEAVHALGKIGGSRARTFVEAVLRTTKAGPSLHEALLAIWKFPRQTATAQLVAGFVASPDTAVQWRAVYALTRAPTDPAVMPAMQTAVTSNSALTRSFAARAFRASTVDSAKIRATGASTLLRLIKDTDAHVRINALSVLAGYRMQEHATEVLPLLNDADTNVRIMAAQALGVIKGPAALDHLSAIARDRNQRPALRGTALASLMAIDTARGLDLAEQMQGEPDAVTRVYVARALPPARSAHAFEIARRFASASDPRLAGAGVTAAAALAGDTLRAARALFIEQLANPDASVRSVALNALGRLAEPGDETLVFDALERALRDDIEDAAVSAIDVLGKLSKTNDAIKRTFTTRFPLSRMKFAQVQREAIKELGVEGTCCQLQARSAEYQRVFNSLVAPALRGGRLPHVRITTENAGAIDLELLAVDAPLTVDNFLSLIRRGYYRGTRWHRVVPNFVLQDGDPTGTGSGGPGYAIRDEINRLRYDRGMLGMALSGPDTGGSQFFITHSPQPHLDGGYTIFGRVVAGMENAEKVVQDDRIVSFEIIP